ncbi:PREDICTED: uncharacterized protein LOC109592280 [Amphimedon queenslandica]|uniref:Uncharacterized protein n=2 Tax=Amphimedon queenslandica TaxID=400682 RepID=A0AAN0K1V5_AMPQE|nr:PREDICTED: uncharacterized protein LOC109592280 [Amphimedon queenslandica]|eukprot:XP_019863331.1 PREDICTED: uncharacterized protein LOC109592280 [Amphimedon queenslandica]
MQQYMHSLFINLVSYSTMTSAMTATMTTVMTRSSTYAVTTTVLVTSRGNVGLIVGVTVVYIPMILLALAMVVVVLVIVMYIKRANQKRKSDNEIVMECSPAYATTEFKTKSTVEPVYDTTESGPPTSVPPPSTEYETPTV